MDRCARVIRQGESSRPARQSVSDESRISEPTGNRGVMGREDLQEVRPWKVQRIAREPKSGPGRVLLVHGLGADFNCDKVFNLFCLYGNVTAVKILRDHQVLVELNDAEAAERCLSNLHLLPLDENNKLKVKYSRHAYIYDRGTVNKLSDGTPAQKSYETSKFHRFPKNKTCVDQRRNVAPSKILHFFNAPLDINCSVIQRAVTNTLGCDDAVQSIVILPLKQPGAKCSTGLIEMKSIDLAAKVILLLNHTTFDSSRSWFPFVMKMCFSKWSEIHQKSADPCSLTFSTTFRNPWLLHRSEQIAPASEFLASEVTPVTCDDCPWILWDFRRRAAETIVPEAGSPAETAAETEYHDQVAEPAVGPGRAAGDA